VIVRWVMATLLLIAAMTQPATALPARTQASADFRKAIDYPAVLKQFGSDVDTVRANAFYSLLFEPAQGAYDPALRVAHLLRAKPALEQRIRATLIRTLLRENTTWGRRAYRPPPPYADYYPHLVTAVGSLNDKAAVKALVGALRSGAADPGLIAIGVAAKPALNVAAQSADPAERAAAARVLARIAAQPKR
jgi:hypothetical protein